MSQVTVDKSLKRKKDEICMAFISLDRQSMFEIGQILFMHESSRQKMKESMDGTRINLDLVDGDIVCHVYSVIQHKMTKIKNKYTS